jgi:nitrite reductase (NO-forming)
MKPMYLALIIIIILIIGLFVFMKTGNPETDLVPLNNEEVDIVEEVPEDIIAVKEFNVSGENFSFTPAVINVKQGDKVKIIFNNTEGFHNFVIDEFNVATKQANSPSTEIVEFTADKVGSFEYYCSVGAHRAQGMKGILKVE